MDITLSNCLVTEICSKYEKYFLTCIYRSPSQAHDEFQNFFENFDILNNNINDEFPICLFVTGNFNASHSKWQKSDTSNSSGQELDSLTLSAGYTKIIDKPTHAVNSSML